MVSLVVSFLYARNNSAPCKDKEAHCNFSHPYINYSIKLKIESHHSWFVVRLSDHQSASFTYRYIHKRHVVALIRRLHVHQQDQIMSQSLVQEIRIDCMKKRRLIHSSPSPRRSMGIACCVSYYLYSPKLFLLSGR